MTAIVSGGGEIVGSVGLSIETRITYKRSLTELFNIPVLEITTRGTARPGLNVNLQPQIGAVTKRSRDRTYYHVGTKVKIDITIADETGVLIDPGAGNIAVSYIAPDGTTVTKTYNSDPEVVRVSAGRYYLLFTVSTSGRWTGKVALAGSKPSVALDRIYVFAAS